jgi:hypothetical protein
MHRVECKRFGQHLDTEGYIARGGQMIDATKENEATKAGKRPKG